MFNREWFSHSEPLSGRRKTGPGIEIFKREWRFQTENENIVRGGMVFHVFERELTFSISGPSGCGKGFPANFNAAGKLFPDFPAARMLLLQNQPLRERSWICSSETATAFLSFSEQQRTMTATNATSFPIPKGPGRIKNTTTYWFTIAVLIHYLWRSDVHFPRKTRCFRDPAVLFYYRRIFPTTVVN